MAAPTTDKKLNGKTGLKRTLSYDISAVAVSTAFTTDWIDRAEHPDVTMLVVNKQGVASAGESLDIQGSNDKTKLFGLSRGDATQNAATNTNSGAGMKTTALPAGRYVRAKWLNGATAQAADSVLTFELI